MSSKRIHQVLRKASRDSFNDFRTLGSREVSIQLLDSFVHEKEDSEGGILS
jgi:hypothetical protein